MIVICKWITHAFESACSCVRKLFSVLISIFRVDLTNYRRILDCFGMMFGLALNYVKSSIIPFNCSKNIVDNLRASFGCLLSSLPIIYLGIPLGANPQRVSTWRPIVDKIEKKLSGWRANLLSKAGRLVLIKMVLNSLPIYYLGLFKMPKTIS